MESKWLTEKEAGPYIKRSVTTLQQWRHKGTGPKYRKDPHGNVYYHQDDLDCWITGDIADDGDDKEG